MIKRAQNRILLSVPHMSGREEKYVTEAFRSNWLSTVGPNLVALEQEFSARMGLPCVALSSGTAAIHLGLRLMNIRAGDEVIVSTLTFAASCNPVLYEQGVPVFMDCDYSSWNLDPQLLADFLRQRAAVNRIPKALIIVHLFGQAADMEPILGLCREYGVRVIEDAAEALGALYRDKPVGTMGDVGIFSFNGNKIITCSGGGMLVSPEADLVARARFWGTQARDPGLNYLHSELGYNYRLSNVLAGIARGQLEVLDERVEQRRAVAARYQQALSDVPGLSFMPEASYGLHTKWLSCCLFEPKEFGTDQLGLLRALDEANIEARPVWKPLHTQKLYQRYESVGGAVAEDLNQRGICLPSSSSLSLDDQAFIIDVIRHTHASARRTTRVSTAVGT
jgi:pyridoxal phosphate-dependent aminotransferase EpsN